MLRSKVGYLIGLAGVLAAVLILMPFRGHINSTPVALTFMLVVLFTAVGYGSNPALLASVASVVSINFFFLKPYHTLAISDPQNWVALATFLITSLIAGGLSAREKRRAEEAESRKKEMERLYVELQQAFEKASQAEAIKQSEQLKSALLDAVTHDLRTPLTSAKAAVTTILAGGGEPDGPVGLDDEGRHELLEVIDSELDRLNHLLEGLLKMAKIEAGAMEPRRSWSNVEEIISICLARAADITSEHTVRVDLQQNLPPVRVDEKAVAEVLYVLVENAAKYSHPGTDIFLTVRTNGENTLQVSVEDHGPGIPVELRERVFEKFFRFSAPDPGIRPRVAGLGMGLAIARGIVESHKGRIWIEAAPLAKGTRVCFTIPLVEQEIAGA